MHLRWLVFALLSVTTACDSCRDQQYLPESQRLPMPKACAEPPADAIRLPNGMQYAVLTPGRDDYRPRYSDLVRATIHGWTRDGTHFLAMVETSVSHDTERGPMRIASTVAQSMTEGEKRRFWAHTSMLEADARPELAWPRGEVCIDMEIISINAEVRSRIQEIPAELRAPPQEAEAMPSGIQLIYLARGEGDRHPGPDDLIEVVASAWYLSGHQQGPLIQTKLLQTTPTDAPGATGTLLQTMVEGDRIRAWLPAGQGVPATWGPRDVPMVVDLKLSRIF